MKRKELLDNIKLILPLLNQYNDGTIHVQISFLQGLECALENGDSLPTIRESITDRSERLHSQSCGSRRGLCTGWCNKANNCH